MTDKDFKTKIKTFSNKELLEQMDFMTEGYYSDLVEVCLEELRCRLEATKWHYPSKGDNPHVTGSYLVFAEGENGLQYAIGEYFAEENRKRWMNANEWHLELDGVSGTFDPIAWMSLPEPPKEEA